MSPTSGDHAILSSKDPDPLSIFLTITVIIHHCIYTLVGGWWPLQPIYPDLLTFQVGLYLLQLNQSYFMGLFFLLSVSSPIYELLINPFVVLAVAAIQSKTIDPPRILQDYYRIFHPSPTTTSGSSCSSSPATSPTSSSVSSSPTQPLPPQPPSKPSTTPSRLPTILIITTALSLFLGITTYLTRISFPIGIVYPVVGAVSYLPQYILAYALGITLTHHTILSYLPHRSPHLLLTSLTIVAILSASLGCTTFLSDLSLIYGGTSIPAFLFAVFESGLAVFMWLLMVVLFSGWFNGNNVTGCEKRIVESAYAWMHYLGVFGVTSVICVVVSWGIGVMVRAIPRVDVVL
ncbi:hypothetical protein BC829DRAFT_391370 [Chytridium lagenaria]|nr:hypothetical protein BC829DRAFT_391370 [Chytridium lagenaria]